MSMKRALRLLTVALGLVTLAGSSVAIAAPATITGKVKHLTGTVVPVNENAKTLTVKRMVRQKEHQDTFAIGQEAVATLTQLKPGEHVRVSYVEAGGIMTAESIAMVPMAKHAKAPVKANMPAAKTESPMAHR
jgi:hypothetical protein